MPTPKTVPARRPKSKSHKTPQRMASKAAAAMKITHVGVLTLGFSSYGRSVFGWNFSLSRSACMQQFLYFFPLPHGHFSFLRVIVVPVVVGRYRPASRR